MDGNQDDATRGRHEAEEAWRQEAGAMLTNHQLYATAPILTESGLPLRVTMQSSTYVNAWNKRTSQLLAAQGLPAWAPGARVPSAEVLAAAVAKAVAPAEFSFASPHERSYLRRSFLRYRPEDEKDVKIARIDDNVVLLTSSLGYVDLIDTKREEWFVRVRPQP